MYFEDGVIIGITDGKEYYDKEYDAGDMYVSPGFIDTHTHGGGGFDFTGTTEDVINGCNFHLEHGTTSICPTISAAPINVMSNALESIKNAKGKTKNCIIGAHMEGPYLSASQCGAQCPDFIIPPQEKEYRELVEKYPGIIVRWTYAPENDEGGKFCKFLNYEGIVASAGHSDAVYSDMCEAIDNGCNLVTHLFSSTSTITRKEGFRYLGVIESTLLQDELCAEIIADGKHLPPELIKLILKVKGTDNVIMCTDSLAVAGSDVKHGFMVATEFIIEDGVCKLVDRSGFAGSIATADILVRVMVNEVGISVPEAVKMITLNPSKIMKLNKGSFEKGKDADIVVFDSDINIRKIFVSGREV